MQQVLNKVQAQKGELARLYKQNAEYKAEIERLMGEVALANDEIYKVGTIKAEELVDELTKAQVAAIKDFAERLKAKSIYFPVCPVHIKGVATIDIDNLVKEMVGDA